MQKHKATFNHSVIAGENREVRVTRNLPARQRNAVWNKPKAHYTADKNTTTHQQTSSAVRKKRLLRTTGLKYL